MPENTNKMAAVRHALSELGKNAMPSAIQDFVKDHYQLSMTPGHISNYKSTILKGKGGRKRRGRKAGMPAKAAVGRDRASGIKVQEVLSLKAMVSRVGADQLKALIDVVKD